MHETFIQFKHNPKAHMHFFLALYPHGTARCAQHLERCGHLRVYGQPREAAVFIGMCVNLLLPEEENEKWLEARIELVTLRLKVERS